MCKNVAFGANELNDVIGSFVEKQGTFMTKPYLTIAQTAEICSVNRSTVNRWVKSGKINSYSTPGGHHRILIKDLTLFLKQNQMPIELDKLEENKNRILIVDDDLHIQEYLGTILGGVFIEIAFASDGFEAGMKMMEFKPQLIILDLSMPKMDGFQLCKIIKENPSTKMIKVLILTGNGTKENKDRAISLGADAFLAKPCSSKELIKQVEMLLK